MHSVTQARLVFTGYIDAIRKVDFAAENRLPGILGDANHRTLYHYNIWQSGIDSAVDLILRGATVNGAHVNDDVEVNTPDDPFDLVHLNATHNGATTGISQLLPVQEAMLGIGPGPDGLIDKVSR